MVTIRGYKTSNGERCLKNIQLNYVMLNFGSFLRVFVK